VKAILLLNSNGSLTRWQADALREAKRSGLLITGILLAASQNKRKIHSGVFGYYTIASFAQFGNPWMKRRSSTEVLDDSLSVLKVNCIASGSWDVLPSEAWDFCARNDVMIKFGLGLLRIPENLPLRHGVLSYHHGDPRSYRGRPAGFHEMANHEPVMGVIVQRLSNVLDGGEVLAEAKSPVYAHSYRATLTDAYRSGVPLLGMAVRNLSTDRRIGLDSLGKNYSLPDNSVVAKFLAQQAAASASRLAYGAFRQKAWQVGYSAISLNLTGGDTIISSSEINRTPTPKPYSFLADP